MPAPPVGNIIGLKDIESLGCDNFDPATFKNFCAHENAGALAATEPAPQGPSPQALAVHTDNSLRLYWPSCASAAPVAVMDTGGETVDTVPPGQEYSYTPGGYTCMEIHISSSNHMDVTVTIETGGGSASVENVSGFSELYVYACSGVTVKVKNNGDYAAEVRTKSYAWEEVAPGETRPGETCIVNQAGSREVCAKCYGADTGIYVVGAGSTWR